MKEMHRYCSLNSQAKQAKYVVMLQKEEASLDQMGCMQVSMSWPTRAGFMQTYHGTLNPVSNKLKSGYFKQLTQSKKKSRCGHIELKRLGLEKGAGVGEMGACRFSSNVIIINRLKGGF